MTIKDIAAKTGYAVGTVSRALNNHPNVSPKARAAIQQAAAEMGFEMNVNAKQLKQTHSNTILMVVKGTRNELFGEMVEKIQQLISETRYQLVVDYMDEDANEAARAIKLCREKKWTCPAWWRPTTLPCCLFPTCPASPLTTGRPGGRRWRP